MIRCDPGTDSIVWMEEDEENSILHVHAHIGMHKIPICDS